MPRNETPAATPPVVWWTGWPSAASWGVATTFVDNSGIRVKAFPLERLPTVAAWGGKPWRREPPDLPTTICGEPGAVFDRRGRRGLAIAAGGLRGFEAWNPLGALPARGVGLSLRVFGVATLLTFLTALGFGTLPAFFASRADLNQALRGMSRGLTTEMKRVSALAWITGAQISLALVLLAGAGLLFSTLLHLEGQNFNFSAARIKLWPQSAEPALSGSV